MDLLNETRNQHFVPQVEQRLNAANPIAPLRDQRIFSFKVQDRESFSIRLESRRGRLISGNLALNDLFTFDVSEGHGLRLNFEALFQTFERNVATITAGLLDKLSRCDHDVGDEVVKLFSIKLLNFARNPFSVVKILNTFGALANYQPTAPAENAAFERVLNGRRPHQAWLCTELGISDSDYERWLRLLFMLLSKSGDDDLTMLDSTVRSVFLRKGQAIAVLVGTYSKARCLLSDRSFSQTTDRQDQMGFEFNLRSDAFVQYLFAEHVGLLPHIPPALIERYRDWPHPVNLFHSVDDLHLLRSFNRRAVYQCHNRVFCSVRDGICL